MPPSRSAGVVGPIKRSSVIEFPMSRGRRNQRSSGNSELRVAEPRYRADHRSTGADLARTTWFCSCRARRVHTPPSQQIKQSVEILKSGASDRHFRFGLRWSIAPAGLGAPLSQRFFRNSLPLLVPVDRSNSSSMTKQHGFSSNLLGRVMEDGC